MSAMSDTGDASEANHKGVSAPLNGTVSHASYGTAAAEPHRVVGTVADSKPLDLADELSTGQLTLILGSTYLGTVLAALDSTLVATTTASISATFNSLRLLAWLISAYFIANSVLQPLTGKLTDIYGRRNGLIVCNLVFAVGNLICGLGQSANVVILGRVVAGLGGGGLFGIPLILANDLVPTRRRGVWQGFNNIAYGVGQGLGGLVGGALNDSIGWRSGFYLMVPLALLSCLMVAFFAAPPEGAKELENDEDASKKWQRIDVLGSATLIAGIVLLLAGLNSGGNTVPWSHPLILASLPLSAALFLAFFYIEAYIAIEPMIPVRLILDQTVASACLTTWFFSMAQTALTFYAPIFFQIQGKSARTAGLLLIPTSVGAMVGGILTGILIRTTGTYYLLNIVVQITFLLPLGLATRFNLHTPVILPIIYFFCTGTAYAGKLTVTITALVAAVSQKDHATITSASFACKATGSTIGTSIASLIFQNVLNSALWARFGEQRDASRIIGRLKGSLEQIKSLPTEGGLRQDAQDAYIEAMRGVFWTIFAMAALGTAASLFMRELKLHTRLSRD